jgi:hypothetical protein
MSSRETIQLRGPEPATQARSGRGEAGTPAWWLVLARELTDLWVGGKALTLLFLYSVILGVQSYVWATNSELSLIPPKEMVYETAKTAIAASGSGPRLRVCCSRRRAAARSCSASSWPGSRPGRWRCCSPSPR